jgi:hypothetical protein
MEMVVASGDHPTSGLGVAQDHPHLKFGWAAFPFFSVFFKFVIIILLFLFFLKYKWYYRKTDRK